MAALYPLEPLGLVETVRHAAERSGLPRRTLYHWISQEKLWSYTIDGGVIVVWKADIDKLIELAA